MRSRKATTLPRPSYPASAARLTDRCGSIPRIKSVEQLGIEFRRTEWGMSSRAILKSRCNDYKCGGWSSSSRWALPESCSPTRYSPVHLSVQGDVIGPGA
jgi:hypothetical protein